MKRFIFALAFIVFLSFPSVAYAGEPGGKLEKDKIEKVDKSLQPSEGQVLKALRKAKIDVEYVELVKDYGTKSKGESPFARLYKDKKSNKYISAITTLPQVDSEGVKIEVGWLLSGNKYFAKNNLFECEVNGTQITLTSEGGQLIYQPQLYLDGKEIKASKPTLLGIDPINENYYQNTLEWDYGICTRSLRLIEGSLQGTWVFNSNPKGDVKIAYNHSGNLNLKLGRYAVSPDSEVIPEEVFDASEYPLIIGDTYTGYSTSSDGYLDRWGVNYAVIHDWATGYLVYDTQQNHVLGQDKSGADFHIDRAYLYFDTSDIKNVDDSYDVNINSATLSLYGNLDNSTTDFDMTIQNGQPTYPHDPLVVGDYDQAQYSGDGGNLTTNGFSVAGYNDITMSATGLSWIQLGASAMTKLCLRSSRDISSTAPAGLEYVRVWASEKGTGYEPKLVVIFAPALLQYIEWEYDSVFTDLTGSGNDATPTFRDASSDADVSAELVSFTPIAEAKAPDYVLSEAPDFIDSDALTGNVTAPFTTVPPAGTFPLAGVITAVASATGTPAQLPLLIIAGFIILAASLCMSAIMRRYGSGTLIVKIIVITAFMGIFIALRNFGIDFWMLVTFLVISIALAMASRQLGWT